MNERPEREPWLEVLTPPGGGLPSLRARLARYERRRRRLRATAGAGAGLALAALAVVLLWTTPPHGEAGLGTGDELLAMRLGLVEPPAEAVSVPAGLRRQLAVSRVPTSDARVVFYRVGRVE